MMHAIHGEHCPIGAPTLPVRGFRTSKRDANGFQEGCRMRRPEIRDQSQAKDN
jgi:hypothetical protein